jgi:phosphatidylserine synthase
LGAAADSAADFVSGGIAPAILLAHNRPKRQTRWSRIAPGVYIAAAASRSARRGMKPRISHVFSGVPPIGAGVILAAGYQMRLPPRALTYIATALSFAMVSNIRVLSVEAIIRRDLPLDIAPGES